jgi:hypothetical protein
VTGGGVGDSCFAGRGSSGGAGRVAPISSQASTFAAAIIIIVNRMMGNIVKLLLRFEVKKLNCP